jgi:hypothetical protein
MEEDNMDYTRKNEKNNNDKKKILIFALFY